MTDDDCIRLDIWLDVACVFKSRSQAQHACKLGRIRVNGDRGKPRRIVRPGDEIRISYRGGSQRILEIVGIETDHVPKPRARELYLDHTPPPTQEETELRRLQRLATPPHRIKGSGAPKKKERRRLRRLKDAWDE